MYELFLKINNVHDKTEMSVIKAWSTRLVYTTCTLVSFWKSFQESALLQASVWRRNNLVSGTITSFYKWAIQPGVRGIVNLVSCPIILAVIIADSCPDICLLLLTYLQTDFIHLCENRNCLLVFLFPKKWANWLQQGKRWSPSGWLFSCQSSRNTTYLPTYRKYLQRRLSKERPLYRRV